MRPAKPTALSLAKAVAFSSVIHTGFIVSNSNLKVKCMVGNVCERQVLGCLKTCVRALLMLSRACFDQGTTEHEANAAAVLWSVRTKAKTTFSLSWVCD